jgi:pyruvate formate lyase activating enzyme
MLGCDLHCSYCQNWVTSQALRDPNAVSPPMEASPELLVQDALSQGAKVLVSTYNEPLITSEWAVAVFRAAREAGLLTGFVSNGNGTPKVLEYLRPWIDLYKVDLKSFDDRHYRQLGGRLQPILDTIRRLHEMGFWLEIVTLLIPGFNDCDDERVASRVRERRPLDIPWRHGIYKDYKMTSPDDTSADDRYAATIGHEAGLRYVYAEIFRGASANWKTRTAISAAKRSSAAMMPCRRISSYAGRELPLATPLPGRWSRQFNGQIASHFFFHVGDAIGKLTRPNCECRCGL